jgi:uncharacterized protein YbjT (DUF2867 family)
MAKDILVTGATGNIAGLVIPQLLENGDRVRALVRDPAKAKDLLDNRVELFEGDFSNTEALDKAAVGVDAVLAITPPNPDAVQQGKNILGAAKKSGDPFYLRISALKAGPDAPQENGRLHIQSDQDLINSGLSYTILRPHYFMQNLFMSVDTIKNGGNMYLGMGEGKLGMIDVRDIADCVVHILIHGGQENKILTPTGPEPISFGQVAELISKKLGRDVNYIKISPDDVRKAIIDMGWGEWGGDVMAGYSKAYSEGWGDFITDDVKLITGKEPRSFENFYDEVLGYALG